MAEISDREYQLIMTAINSNASAVQGLTAVVNDLNITLAREYLTREEDAKNDEERIGRLYTYVGEQVKIVRSEAVTGERSNREIHDGFGSRMTMLMWMVGIQFSFILALAVAFVSTRK